MNWFSHGNNQKSHVFQVLAVFLLALALASVSPQKSEAGHKNTPKCSDKYHFILVHGAWHGGWAWYKVQTQLEKAGHKVTVVDLPGHGIDKTAPETVTLADYANRVIEAMDDANEPVVLVGHSMGGVAISMAAEARPDSIDKLIYLAAFLLEDGVSLIDIASIDTESTVGANLIPGNGILDINRDVVEEAFYGMSPESDITLAKSLLVVNPLLPIVTPVSVTEQNFGSVPRYYIATTNDNSISPDIQEYMYTTTPCEEVFTIHSDHSPFFSRPTHLTKLLLRIADK
ncbi:MAG: alpha/beta fold hydrolase [Deltaproteobacteria bacterium]|nr:alpha/beta fold hydrolase [Deltaproteobacteria bacterium]